MSAREIQKLQMARVQDVEASVGKHDALAGAAIASSVALVFESASLFFVAKYRLGLHCFIFGSPHDS